MSTPWVNFLTTEHERVTALYAKSGEEYKKDVKAEAANKNENQAPADNEFKFTAKETFKQTYKPAEPETDVATARVPAVPPHVRNKSA